MRYLMVFEVNLQANKASFFYRNREKDQGRDQKRRQPGINQHKAIAGRHPDREGHVGRFLSHR